jgi:K+-transporting ATPase ATPase C chain
MFHEMRTCFVLFFLLAVIAGLGYPALMFAVGQKLFPAQANGSLIEDHGTIIGSELIGQNFSADKYFHPRPSAAGNGYDASNSSGSNLGPTSADLLKAVGDRVAEVKKTAEGMPIPVDLVTSSASGLDPDISPASAHLQATRVAAARHLDVARVNELIAQNTSTKTFGVLGEDRVNVLALNRTLDGVSSAP